MNEKHDTHPGYTAGFAERDITYWEEGIQLFGWGIPSNRALSVAAPLAARAMHIAHPHSGTSLTYVCADLTIITHAVRRRVLKALHTRLGENGPVHEHNLLITATHTHSAPSGLSEYLMYCLSGPGFSESIVSGVVSGIVESIVEAIQCAEPAELRFAEVDVPLNEEIAFNRSMVAWSNNPETDPASTSREEAVRRVFPLLRADTPEGKELGAVSFFPTHSTVVHSDHTVVHPDHKGIAAQVFTSERRASGGNTSFVGIFAQEAAGDVTPNHRYNRRRRRFVGKHDDDFINVQYVADRQAELALRAFRAAGETPALPATPLRARVGRRDFSDFALGDGPEGTVPRTSSPIMGMGFMQGTREGPGPLLPFRGAMRAVTDRIHKRQKREADERNIPVGALFPQGNKLTFLEAGAGVEGRAFNLFDLRSPPRADFIDVTVKRYRAFLREGAVDSGPWIPRVTTTQLVSFGGIVIAALSGEVSTVAGARIREAALRQFPNARSVIVQGYANSYNSYIVTPEEYDMQSYEGAGTIYGRHTLDAYLFVLRDLCDGLDDVDKTTSCGDTPWVTDPEVLSARNFGPQYARMY